MAAGNVAFIDTTFSAANALQFSKGAGRSVALIDCVMPSTDAGAGARLSRVEVSPRPSQNYFTYRVKDPAGNPVIISDGSDAAVLRIEASAPDPLRARRPMLGRRAGSVGMGRWRPYVDRPRTASAPPRRNASFSVQWPVQRDALLLRRLDVQLPRIARVPKRLPDGRPHLAREPVGVYRRQHGLDASMSDEFNKHLKLSPEGLNLFDTPGSARLDVDAQRRAFDADNGRTDLLGALLVLAGPGLAVAPSAPAGVGFGAAGRLPA